VFLLIPKGNRAARVVMTERDSHLTQEKGNVEDTLKMGFISRDCWPTGVERVTHALEGRKLIRETQFRS
jgi:hypothetical protein